MTGALGGLTSVLFNLLHSKKYKANSHLILDIKKDSRAYKSRISKKGELTCIKIDILCYLFTQLKEKEVTNHHTPITQHLIHLSIFDRKIFIGISKPCPVPRSQEKCTRITRLYKTAPGKHRDLHGVSSVLRFSVTR